MNIITYLINTIGLPVLTGVVASAIYGFWSQKNKSKKIIDSTEIARKRLIDTITPYFVQKIHLEESILLDVRNTLISEYQLKEDKTFSLISIKEQLITNILENLFLTETEKYDLVKFSNQVFSTYTITEDSDTYKEEFLRKEYSKVDLYELLIKIVAIIFMLIMITQSFAPLINTIQTNLSSELQPVEREMTTEEKRYWEELREKEREIVSQHWDIIREQQKIKDSLKEKYSE